MGSWAGIEPWLELGMSEGVPLQLHTALLERRFPNGFAKGIVGTQILDALLGIKLVLIGRHEAPFRRVGARAWHPVLLLHHFVHPALAHAISVGFLPDAVA